MRDTTNSMDSRDTPTRPQNTPLHYRPQGRDRDNKVGTQPIGDPMRRLNLQKYRTPPSSPLYVTLTLRESGQPASIGGGMGDVVLRGPDRATCLPEWYYGLENRTAIRRARDADIPASAWYGGGCERYRNPESAALRHRILPSRSVGAVSSHPPTPSNLPQNNRGTWRGCPRLKVQPSTAGGMCPRGQRTPLGPTNLSEGSATHPPADGRWAA